MTRATRRRPRTEDAIEPHPWHHDWYHVGDYVHKRDSRRKPSVVRRKEKCNYCPTVRFTRIDVKTWTRIGNRTYVYAKGVIIVRMSKAQFLKQEFLATTNITGEDLEALRAA